MDGWTYCEMERLPARLRLDTFKAKAERENPGLTYVSREWRGTGLWCDVIMRDANGATLRRTLRF